MKNKLMKYLFSILFLFVVGSTNAQELGSIVGLLTDKEMNNQPLPFANVVLKGTSKGTSSGKGRRPTDRRISLK